ncbi:protein transport protein Sec7p [[Candida] jaroonii]|uniref:Protein transport protein Sec7p n=1 Tax=[Candida] jaroonii TaxID=467808 RepID=A0ACA9YF77_9ASCO|nr:protein transport protein Sec7p [[Candida] jaroonii]
MSQEDLSNNGSIPTNADVNGPEIEGKEDTEVEPSPMGTESNEQEKGDQSPVNDTDKQEVVESEDKVETPEEKPEDPEEEPKAEQSNADVDVSDKESKPLPKINTSDANGANESSFPITPTIEEPNGGNHNRNISISSVHSTNAFVDNSNIFKKTFEVILDTKEAKKNDGLKSSIQKALDSLNDSNSRDPHIIFSALKSICEFGSNDLKTKAIDLFAKLFDYGQFDDEQDKIQLTDNSVDVIASCFDGEGTDAEVELQVVRALMHSILLMPCHGASLLKAIRSIYNVFIFSLTARNQSVAQGILTQVIGAVFQRVIDAGLVTNNKTDGSSQIRTPANLSNDDMGEIIDTPVEQRLTLSNLENLNDDTKDSLRVSEANQPNASNEDIVVKDAFLIFRAMCKLSVKDIEADTLDMRSHSVRSKLLSLHIIHTILKQFIDIFLSRDVVLLSSNNERTRLVNAVRQYLCLSLSRNAASSIAPVFELSLEIFWLIISNLRAEFKREIPVFWDEIYFPVSEMKTSTPHQKRYLLSIIERLSNDSRCIIEFYLNYDCDSNMPNICERFINYLTRLSLVPVAATVQQKHAYRENRRKGVSVYDISRISNLVSSTMASRPPEPDIYNQFPLEYALKMTSLNCIVAFLRSLYTWAQKGINGNTPPRSVSNSIGHLGRNRSETTNSDSPSNGNSRNASFINNSSNGNLEGLNEDDPEQFENLKQRKKALLEGIRQFNQKSKKGVQYFIQKGFIESDSPQDIARFLLETDGLDKAELGEYLGEGKDENIAIMHAFVELMDFTNSSFVDALRTFLQSFRLPGEAQKIDRFMLKFAERYVMGNPGILANAESAYVLSYSVILLNTDLHSNQIKNKMPLEQFIKNNDGIDDNKDIPREYLEAIYSEIANNEIKLQSEQHAALLNGDISLPQNGSSLGLFGGRDLNREAYSHASKEMSTKTEKLVRDLGKKLRDDSEGGTLVFYAATSIYHVKSILDTVWMSILAGLTAPFKEYDDEDIAKNCLEGIKLSIKIACMFDLKDASESFIGALIQFQNLNNYSEMSTKNIRAIYFMLEITISEGNKFNQNIWTSILTSISQLERLQLISRGIDKETIPDVSVAKLVNRNSLDSNNHRNSSSFFRFTSNTSASQTASNKFHNQHLNPEVAELLSSSDLATAVDRVFVNTSYLSGESIVSFIKSLSKVSLEEIESSGQSINPRLFSLQKIVDICYYNMTRIRVEWSQIWAAMGETFNIVGCHSNLNVTIFAIDSLRQLSMRFFDIDELAHFKFQREFLKPFEYIISHNDSLEIKDMILECINNMILAKSEKIKSGWKTIFGVLLFSAEENKETLVNKTFKMVDIIYKKFSKEIKQQDAFEDLIKCFTALCKNGKFQKINLLSLDILQKLVNQIAMEYLKQGENKNETLIKYWFPILFGFHDVIMTGEELEVRSKALNYLFDILLEFGENFDQDFWNLVCKELLFPIFSVLSKPWEVSKIEDSDDSFSVWLSTTLIQALRKMIGLFDHYFESLRSRLTDYLQLLSSCICQENDTIARIGRTCLHDLLLNNSSRFNDNEWSIINESFQKLFKLTEATELFDLDPLKESDTLDEIDVENETENGDVGNNSISKDIIKRTQDKSAIVIKCVLQLLMIDSLNELFENEEFYNSIPYNRLIELSNLLNGSFQFAKKFNDDYDLRVRLWNAGIIERLPNLLKQESSSSAVYINIIFRMYGDDSKTNDEQKRQLIKDIVPLCNNIIERFSSFDETNQQRNLSTWRPVIIVILSGFTKLNDDEFKLYNNIMYKATLSLFSKSLSPELRTAIKEYLMRVNEVFLQ